MIYEFKLVSNPNYFSLIPELSAYQKKVTMYVAMCTLHHGTVKLWCNYFITRGNKVLYQWYFLIVYRYQVSGIKLF